MELAEALLSVVAVNYGSLCELGLCGVRIDLSQAVGCDGVRQDAGAVGFGTIGIYKSNVNTLVQVLGSDALKRS